MLYASVLFVLAPIVLADTCLHDEACSGGTSVALSAPLQLDAMTPLLPTAKRPQYDVVYSIQVGAFDRAEFGQQFASEHGEVPLSCRQKRNGIFAVYYGVYQDYDEAKSHLQDYELLQVMGAYVVKLQDVSFKPCEALKQSIRAAKTQAYEKCTDCTAADMVNSILPSIY